MWELSWITARALDLIEKAGDVLCLMKVALPLSVIVLAISFLSSPQGSAIAIVWVFVPALDGMARRLKQGLFSFYVPPEQEVLRMMRLSLPSAASLLGMLGAALAA